MNKTELIALLRDPSDLTSSHLQELEDILKESPFFLAARLLLAKGSKELNDEKAKERIASAAVYSTDRILLKKYLSGKLFFLSEPPKEAVKEDAPQPVVVAQPEVTTEQHAPVVPEVPSGHLDEILDELKQDMENLRSSRHHFIEVQQKIEEEDAISAALERASRKKKADIVAASAEQDVKDLAEKKKPNGEAPDAIKSREIIDEFLKKEPSIKRAKPAGDKEDPSDDLSETSYSWNKELASETLASIYLDQGNKQRAKEIYEVLMLKFPDKNVYFADLISKIE